jgi:hypothetical protein
MGVQTFGTSRLPASTASRRNFLITVDVTTAPCASSTSATSWKPLRIASWHTHRHIHTYTHTHTAATEAGQGRTGLAGDSLGLIVAFGRMKWAWGARSGAGAHEGGVGYTMVRAHVCVDNHEGVNVNVNELRLGFSNTTRNGVWRVPGKQSRYARRQEARLSRTATHTRELTRDGTTPAAGCCPTGPQCLRRPWRP